MMVDFIRKRRRPALCSPRAVIVEQRAARSRPRARSARDYRGRRSGAADRRRCRRPGRAPGIHRRHRRRGRCERSRATRTNSSSGASSAGSRRCLAEHRTKELVLVGTIMTRPDVKNMKLDFGAVRLGGARRGAAHAGRQRSPERAASACSMSAATRWSAPMRWRPSWLRPPGRSGRTPRTRMRCRDARRAMKAARVIGKLDAGQAAVAINGVIVAPRSL